MSSSWVRENEHSGDVGLEASAPNLEGLIEQMTTGLFDLMHRRHATPKTTRTVRVESSGPEDLMVDWLNEVIACVGRFGEMYSRAIVRRAGEGIVEGEIRGEEADADRHDLRFDVKAATYHELLVEKRDDGYYARVIFDL